MKHSIDTQSPRGRLVRKMFAVFLLTCAWTVHAQFANTTKIGGGALGSIVTNSPGSYTVTGGGNDIWAASDEFTFHYTEIAGDFDVVVRVESLQFVGANWTKAGLMVRESATGSSRMIFPRVSPTLGVNDVHLGYRTGIPGAGSNGGEHEDGSGVPAYPNAWLRLQRVGDVFRGYTGIDGVNWTQLGSDLDTAGWQFGSTPNVPFAKAALLGLAVSRHGAATNPTAIAEFRDYQNSVDTQPVTFAVQPVGQRKPVSFTATFTSLANGRQDVTTYQWFSNGVAIAGATSRDYTTPALTLAANGATYSVAASNSLTATAATSSGAALEVVDNPVVLSVGSRGNPDKVFVVFSKNVTSATALAPANYSLNGVTVDSVTYAPAVAVKGAESAVYLSVSPLLTRGSTYTVSVSGIQDASGLLLEPNPTVSSFTHSIGGYHADFSSGVPAGSQTYGNASVSGGVLQLTTANNDQNSSWIVNDFLNGAPVVRFTARWDARVGGGSSTPADGYSFNFASDLPNGDLQEEGRGTGITVAFDVYDNSGGEAPAIDVKYNGTTISHNLTTVMMSGDAFYPVVINLDSDGTLDVLYNNVVIVSNLVTGYTPRSGRFGWGARTGGLNVNQWLDNVSIMTHALGPVLIEKQPGDTTVDESRQVTWSIVPNGTPPYSVQWFSNSVAIPGANSLTYAFKPTRSANGAVYSATVNNDFSTATTTNVTLTVITDATPPTFTAAGSATFDTVRLRFSEEINLATVTAPGAIRIHDAANNDLTITGLRVIDGWNVVITNDLSATPQLTGTVYTVEITGLADIAGVPNTTNIAVNFTGFIFSPGFVLFQTYDAGGGTGVDLLKNHPTYPDNPRLSQYIKTMNSRVVYGDDSHNDFGGRLIGLLVPPTNGDYRIYISSDDASQFFLSTTESPANKSLIVEDTGCCHAFTERASGLIPLTAGNRYFFEFLYKEGGGGDYAQANLTGNDSNRGGLGAETIGGTLLGVYANPDTAGVTTIVQAPASQLHTENEFASFSVVATNSNGLPFHYQWRKNGIEIAGANSSTYVEGPLSLADDEGYFDVIVHVPGGSIISAPATNTVRGDIVPPSIVRATVDATLRSIHLTFSELVSEGSAQESGNYVITDSTGYPLNASSLVLNSGSNLVITLSAPMAPSGLYTVNVFDVSDLVGNPLGGEWGVGTNVLVQAWALTRGFVQYDFWKGIGGGAVSDLLNNSRYPVDTQPQNHVTYFTNTVNWPQTVPDLNDYGLRISGFFVPTETGEHTFYLRYDDGARMQLSTDESPANLVTIFDKGCCNGDNPPTQASSPVTLTAGQRYYFEAIVKEAGGGDYLGIAVRRPGDIAALYISPANLALLVSPDGGASGSFTQQPADATVEENHSATLSAAFASTGTLPAFIQWQRKGPSDSAFTDIPGASGNTYKTPALVLANSGTEYRAVGVLPGKLVPSASATVTVISDVTKPLVLSIGSATGTKIGVAFDEAINAASAQETNNYAVGGVNPDSVALRPDGSGVELTFGASVTAEFTLSVANVNDIAGNTMTATNVTSHVWLQQIADIGGPLPAGEYFSAKEGAIEIKAGGGDVWGNGGDQFTFGYVSRTGDFDVKVRIDSLRYVGNSWSKAGLHVRTTIATNNSQMIWFYPTPTAGANAFEGGIRPNDGAGFYDFGQPRPAAYYPAWLRLQRLGNAFTAYLSPNGTNWNQFGATQNRPEFPATLLVGMGVVSHIQNTATTAQFSEFGDLRPTITLEANGADLVIRWDGTGVLESSEDTLTWTPVAQAASPYTVAKDLSHRFYRVRRLFPQN